MENSVKLGLTLYSCHWSHLFCNPVSELSRAAKGHQSLYWLFLGQRSLAVSSGPVLTCWLVGTLASSTMCCDIYKSTFVKDVSFLMISSLPKHFGADLWLGRGIWPLRPAGKNAINTRLTDLLCRVGIDHNDGAETRHGRHMAVVTGSGVLWHGLLIVIDGDWEMFVGHMFYFLCSQLKWR